LQGDVLVLEPLVLEDEGLLLLLEGSLQHRVQRLRLLHARLQQLRLRLLLMPARFSIRLMKGFFARMLLLFFQPWMRFAYRALINTRREWSQWGALHTAVAFRERLHLLFSTRGQQRIFHIVWATFLVVQNSRGRKRVHL